MHTSPSAESQAVSPALARYLSALDTVKRNKEKEKEKKASEPSHDTSALSTPPGELRVTIPAPKTLLPTPRGAVAATRPTLPTSITPNIVEPPFDIHEFHNEIRLAAIQPFLLALTFASLQSLSAVIILHATKSKGSPETIPETFLNALLQAYLGLSLFLILEVSAKHIRNNLLNRLQLQGRNRQVVDTLGQITIEIPGLVVAGIAGF